MNENIDLTKILKNCPRGWKFYSSVHGEVKFKAIKFQRLKYRYDPDVPICHQQIFEEDQLPIKFTVQDVEYCVSSVGEHIKGKGECTFFPSKEQRDWSKFTAPWYKKEKFDRKFDPNSFQPFDRVLARHSEDERWDINFYSYNSPNWPFPYTCMEKAYKYCIPYNDETKHLVGTTDEAPEYYKHWKD